MSIKREWAEDDRPREKLKSKGVQALSDSELLGILINSGTSGKTAVDIGREILSSVEGGLPDLGRLTIADFCRFPGIGEARAITLMAALELGRRRSGADVRPRTQVKGGNDVARYLQSFLADKPVEEFWILLLNRANKIIEPMRVSEGGLTGTVVDPRVIFRKAIEKNAVSIILCHNHPSGNTRPSEADVQITRKMREAGKLIDVAVLDHVIVSDSGYFSFAEEGIME
jgi:DNA repair protein RadC